MKNTQWHIPEYAHKHLLINGRPLIEDIDIALGYTIRWGTEQGPILAFFTQKSDIENWCGETQIGGYIDAIHTTTIDDISMVYVGGQPLKQNYDVNQTKSLDFHDALVDDMPDTITTWLVQNNSPLLPAIQNALIHNLRLLCHGKLAKDNSGWVKQFHLPLMLEAITVFAP